MPSLSFNIDDAEQPFVLASARPSSRPGYRSSASGERELVPSATMFKHVERRSELSSATPLMQPLLQVKDLCVDYVDSRGDARSALDGISFDLHAGQTMGILGASGCGKSTLALAILRLLPPGGCIRSGQILFDGADLLSRTETEMQSLRGARISLIFQDPGLALHPTMRVGEQIARILAAHQSLNRRQRADRVRELLSYVFKSDAARIFSSYPHQLSGGQQQRVLIAQAIACKPEILIADEPTASLDPTTQKEILALFENLRRDFQLAIILISHSPAILAQLSDRILVIYAGRVAEEGPANGIFQSPRHPYLRGLLHSVPASPEGALLVQKMQLPTMDGAADRVSSTQGCRFEPRCEERMNECAKQNPAHVMIAKDHVVSCFKYGA